MSYTLQVGETAIPYDVRYSSRAGTKRLVVRAEGVEVVAPEGTPLEGKAGVFAYVDSKRRWLFDARRDVANRHRKLLIQQWASGAKLQYRGRWLMLDVTPADVPAVEIDCRSRFHVRVPHKLSDIDRLEATADAFERWLHARALRDLKRFARLHQSRLGVEAAGVRLSDSKHRWGICGKDRILRVHWRLVQAPAAAMEYVTAHEVVHLVHRHHAPEFWSILAGTLPEWDVGKALLERWEVEHRAV